jgi:hypothetical protein
MMDITAFHEDGDLKPWRCGDGGAVGQDGVRILLFSGGAKQIRVLRFYPFTTRCK